MEGKNGKIYIIDTNVLLYDPQSIFEFKDATIGIPISVLEELDQFKTEKTNRGRNARETTRILDSLRGKGELAKGVSLENGSQLKVVFPCDEKSCPEFLKKDIGDNKILFTSYCLQKEGYDVRFITKDLNARVKADILGIKAKDYHNKDFVSEDQFYKGWMSVEVPSIELKSEFPAVLNLLAKEKQLNLNEFVQVCARSNPFNYKVFRYLGGKHFKHVVSQKLAWPFEAKNPQQLMTLDLLLDDSIQFVTLFGPAGTGKTFLTLLAGLQKVLIEDAYGKILVSRPIVPLGADIGFLPGDMAEKLQTWMQPIHDNMDFIIRYSRSSQSSDSAHQEESFDKKGSKIGKKRGHIPTLQQLISSEKLSLDAITYMRGRSIPYQFIFVDEVQNLTPHEVKTLITRAGQGSKIILAGDPYQIDSPYLSFSSNGLVVSSNNFKGQSIFGSVYLENSERSELSKLAGELL